MAKCASTKQGQAATMQGACERRKVQGRGSYRSTPPPGWEVRGQHPAIGAARAIALPWVGPHKSASDSKWGRQAQDEAYMEALQVLRFGAGGHSQETESRHLVLDAQKALKDDMATVDFWWWSVPCTTASRIRDVELKTHTNLHKPLRSEAEP